MSTKGISTDKCSSSLTISRGKIPPETINRVLYKLKYNLAEANQFEALEKKFIHRYGIKSLLKKLDVPNTPSDVVSFFVVFGPLFDHIFADFQRTHKAQTKVTPKVEARSKEWNLANESDNRAEKMKLPLPWMQTFSNGRKKLRHCS